MTLTEREVYKNEYCQLCGRQGHIAKICWSRSPHNHQFTSKGRGFHATNNSFQYSTFAGNNSGSQPSSQRNNNHVSRPPPPSKRRTTLTKKEVYKNEYCQLCGRHSHIAKICWSLPEQSSNDELPQALAALTMDTTIANTEWTADTGASNHMTANSGILSNLKKYIGCDSVFIGDGSPLTIDAIGDTLVSDGKNKLMLRDVLLVPQLTRKLLSISQLTRQYPLNCEFTDELFYVKERVTGCILLMGQCKGDLYVLSKMKEANFSNRQKFRNRGVMAPTSWTPTKLCHQDL